MSTCVIKLSRLLVTAYWLFKVDFVFQIYVMVTVKCLVKCDSGWWLMSTLVLSAVADFWLQSASEVRIWNCLWWLTSWVLCWTLHSCVDCGAVLSQTACLCKLCSQIILMLESLGKSIIKVSYYWFIAMSCLSLWVYMLHSLVEGTMVVRLE